MSHLRRSKRGQASQKALDAALDRQREAYEARIKAVVEENVHLAVELKVARSGYTDAAELLFAAQSRVRDLERYLAAERSRVGRVEQQLIALKQEHSNALIQSLKDRIAALERAQQAALAHPYGDGTRYERTDFTLPEGIEAAARDHDSARGLMQRHYLLRAQQREG